MIPFNPYPYKDIVKTLDAIFSPGVLVSCGYCGRQAATDQHIRHCSERKDSGMTPREKFEALASSDPNTRAFELMWLRRAATAFSIFVERQKKYGPTNIARHGCTGVIVRLGDKLARLEHTYIEGYPMPPDESPVDAWIDGANYNLIGWMCHDGEWPGVKGFRHSPPPAEQMEIPF
jgi:hypothetical protein